MTPESAAAELRDLLTGHADPVFADQMQRYFPDRLHAIGVGNGEVADLAYGWVRDHPEQTPADRLAIADAVIARSEYHEEVLMGFAVLHRTAKNGLGPELLDRCRDWLENHVSNWAQCDDMCLKLLYPFFLGHLETLPQTRAWVDSQSSWARRAANVAVVKFVRRRVGRQVFELPLSHVFDNCTALMRDEDVYVQKSCGWLLKVAAQVHPEGVEDYLRTWHDRMKRDTFRYAIEKLDPRTRSALMALNEGARR